MPWNSKFVAPWFARMAPSHLGTLICLPFSAFRFIIGGVSSLLAVHAGNGILFLI